MKKYDIKKPIFLTETGYLCPDVFKECNPVGAEFFQKQAEYGIWLILRNWAEGIDVSFWYPYDGPGWRSGSIMDTNQEPKPVYGALKYTTSLLNEAKKVKRIDDLPQGLLGYELSMDDKLYWIVTSRDSKTYNLTLPQNVIRIYDVFENLLPINEGYVEIASPMYIEISLEDITIKP
jgi:hypothetical protein